MQFYFKSELPNLFDPVGNTVILRGDGEHDPKMAPAGGRANPNMAATGGGAKQYPLPLLPLQKNGLVAMLNKWSCFISNQRLPGLATEMYLGQGTAATIEAYSSEWGQPPPCPALQCPHFWKAEWSPGELPAGVPAPTEVMGIPALSSSVEIHQLRTAYLGGDILF